MLWSRLADLDARHLDVLMWERKELFHYWAHAASLGLTSDYPLHEMRMRKFFETDGLWVGPRSPFGRRLLRDNLG